MAETEKSSPTKAFKRTRQPKKPLIVFFLDLDDVLITHRASHGIGPGTGLFNTIDPVAMGLFNRLAEKVEKKTGAEVRVVLISAKRNKSSIKQMLRRNGLKPKFHRDWRTDFNGPHRSFEVDRWLAAHPQVKDYQIFDDISDFGPHHKERHVCCPGYDGLSWENFQQVKRYFGIKPGE